MSPFTIRALAERSAAVRGEAIAVTDDEGSVTFGELYRRSCAAADAIRGLGAERGDRVGVCMAKGLDQVVVVLGVLFADAVVVPILPGLKPDNVAHIGRDSAMKAVVTDAGRAAEAAGAGDDVAVVMASDVTRPAAGPTTYRSRSIGSDVAAIIYSSGSTGRPKGIVISHRNLVDGARIVAGYLGTRADDQIAGVLSLNFDYGLNQLWQSLLTGATLHLHQFVFPADLFRFLAERRVTVLPVMPVLVTRMFDPRLMRNLPDVDLSAVRTITSSGGAVSPRMTDELTRAFPAADIVLMYGLTEAFRSTWLPPAERAARPTSIGVAIPDVEVLVLDEDLREVPPGVPGQLVHRGGCVAKGYWNAPEATRATFRRLDRFPGETVVFSGDVVTRDEAGFLYFVGRADAMIKTMGFRVSPTEVEEVALRFDGVSACVAFGVANVEVGEDVALAYTARPGHDAGGFRRFLQEGLPTHMVPRHVLEDEAFPATGNEGKIDRQAVVARGRERIAAAGRGG
jgi:amino acid adenylation domain-containing protein